MSISFEDNVVTQYEIPEVEMEHPEPPPIAEEREEDADNRYPDPDTDPETIELTPAEAWSLLDVPADYIG